MKINSKKWNRSYCKERNNAKKTKKVKHFCLIISSIITVLVLVGIIGLLSLKKNAKRIIKTDKKALEEKHITTLFSDDFHCGTSIKLSKQKESDYQIAPVTNRSAGKYYGRSSNIPSTNIDRIREAPSASGMTVVGWDGEKHIVKSRAIFKNRVDNMFWAAIRPGGMPSGLNSLRARMRYQTGNDAAFFQTIKDNNIPEISYESPYSQLAKEIVNDVKNRIVKEMEGGRTFDEVFQEICETTYKERMYERIAQEEFRKLSREGDAEIIREYVNNINPIMESMGLKALHLPSWAE